MTTTSPLTDPNASLGAGTEAEGAVAPCQGWIQINSHYVDYNIDADEDIAVGYTAVLSRITGTEEAPVTTAIETVVVNYTQLMQDTAAEAGDIPATAATNGNPKVNIGGAEGYPAGRYKLTLTPEINHGKVRLRHQPEENNNYAILNTEGEASEHETDEYVQVPAGVAVQTSWSETFELRCGPITTPHSIRFAWADFATWDRWTNARITGTGNLGQPGLDASAACLRRISANMTTALGRNWRQVAVSHAYFPLDPRIRYWAFLLVNKTEELNDRRVRITNPGRSANFQRFLRERMQQCNGATAAAPWHSNHQYGLAFDAAHGRAMDQAPAQNTDIQVLLADAIGLDWGGNWQRADRPHFERNGASANTANYRNQLTGTPPTILTYGGHNYVQTP